MNPDPTPRYSIIVPAYNEGGFLAATLTAIMESTAALGGPVEVIVVDNNSTDSTAAIARDFGARVVAEPINQISRARNAGARAARGPYLIFIDADTLVSGPLLDAALEKLDSGTVSGGGTTIAIDTTHRLAMMATASWNWLATRLPLAAGCFIYCRRDAFEAIGGFSEAVYASEELWLSRDLKRWSKRHGYDFVVLDIPVMTSARKLDWLSAAQIFRQTMALVLFPFAVRSKRWCQAWYFRPDDTDARGS